MSARSLRIAASIAALAVLFGCTKASQSGGAPAEQTHVLRFASGGGDLPSLNPHLYTELDVGYIAQLSQAYLVRYNRQNLPIPELATEVPTKSNGGISADGTAITWHLRKGARWSDGAPFTADDVIFTVGVIMNPANNETSTDGWDLITKMDEPDKYTVVFHLKHPYGVYLPTFFGTAGATPCILPKHLLAQYPNINNVSWNSKPVGIGPFRVIEWKRGEAVILEANPYYFRGTPKLKRIEFKLIPSRETLETQLRTGEIDLWPYVQAANINVVKPMENLNVDVNPSPQYAHLDFNISHPLVSDIRVRQAIRYAIDRKALAEKTTHGYSVVQESIVPAVNPIAPTPQQVPFVAFDPQKARALLDAAGWKVGPDGIRVRNGQRLSLDFPFYTGSATAEATVEFIRSNLKDVGIEIQTRQFAPANFFAQPNGIIYGGKFDVTMFAWAADPVGDISAQWECKLIPPHGQNVVRYCNPKLDALLEQFKGTYDVEEHRKLLAQEVKMIDDDVPTITLYVLDNANAMSKNLTGYHPGAWTAFDDMMNVDI